MSPHRRRFIGLAAAAAATPWPARAAPALPAVFYACQSGHETLDEGFGGGNPFASAVMELIADRSLTLGALPGRLRRLTASKSDGFQDADVPAAVRPVAYRLAGGSGGKRIALVMIESAYGAPGVAVLPGAARDGRRIAETLQGAGFEVSYRADLDRAAMLAVLDDFATRSRAAEAAVIYSTGHGVESGGVVHLLARDYAPGRGEARLRERSVTVPTMAGAAQARTVNLVFWAGCRSPFTY